ncbi:MAG: S-layer homology domain-containing protein, partial [Clostridia bacterium]|nr:S-layer homology domain-containing protein [Clostridia bacterium]
MKLKKIISGFLCSAMMLSTAIIGVSVNATDELPFTDVPDTWYTDAVKCVYNEGIMKGKSETAFDPTAKITRAEVVTAFSRVAITKTSGMGENLPFDDTVSGQWYSDSVGWAAENGIVTGRGNGIFSPADNITRAELASILTKFVNYMGIDLPDAPKLDKFADADTFDSWMISPIEAVRKNGLMQGTDGKFNPKGNATRAEIAQVIMNLLPATGRSIIAENGMSDYVIVIDEANQDAVDAAERLVWQVDELCGVTLDVIDDGVKATSKEIILGKTSRGTKINTSDMILDGYEILIDGDKIYIDGATADGLYGGVVSLLNTCISGIGMRFTSKSACVYEDKYPIGKLTIAGNDISKYTIYYPADAGENLVGAVEDMAIIIEDACGVKLPIKTGTAADYGIIIETVKSDKEFDDSFTVKNAGTNIVISGHENLGAVHGIYDLLEEYLGARYLSEADYGKYPSIAYICEAESLDLSGINYTEEPYFTYRVNCATTNRAASISKTFRDITWATPNCHTFGYFATEDGIYNNDVVPCLSDENMKTRIVTRLREWIDNYIGRTGEIPDAVSLSYADTSAY